MRRGRDPFKLREPIATWMRDAVIARDLGVCQLCLKPVERDDEIHIDHRIPHSLGGATLPSNLQLAHATCNLRKGNRV
jgi:5-methylcytosine-specific restriction endonuclease McrA